MFCTKCYCDSFCSLQELHIDNILKTCKLESSRLPSKRGSKRSPHTVQEAATALQQSLEEWTNNEPDRLAQAKSGDFRSLVFSYIINKYQYS